MEKEKVMWKLKVNIFCGENLIKLVFILSEV